MKKIFLLLCLAIAHTSYAKESSLDTKQDQTQQSLKKRYALHPERVARGKQLLCAILSDNPATGTRTEYLNHIIDLLWYFHAQALQKKQGFLQGTFIIHDNQQKIYNYLINYVKLVNPSITGTLQDKVEHISFNPFGYARASSHFKKSQKEFRHYGIDMRLQKSEKALPLLPVGNTHLLFGIVNRSPEKTILFIKPESVGISSKEVARHGIEFIKSKIRKLAPKLIKSMEKILPEKLVDSLLENIGSDDDALARRERIPHQFVESMNDILTKGSLAPESVAHYLEKVVTNGIQYAYALDQRNIKPSDWSDSQWKNFKEFFARYKKVLAADHIDHLDVRFGREVIFTTDELNRWCFN